MRLELAPSPALAAAIVVLHAAAALSAVLVLPDWRGALLAAALLALGVASAWSRALLRSGGSVRSIELLAEGEARLENRRGERLEVRPRGRRYVSRLLVTLPVARPRGALLVTRGMLAADPFRRLRIWALWGRLPRVAPKQLPG